MFPTDPTLSRWEILRREPEFTIAQIILWFFVALTSLQVIMRYVFDAPLQWPEELTQILLVWMTFIAAVGLSRQGLHIRVEIVENFLGPRGAQRAGGGVQPADRCLHGRADRGRLGDVTAADL